MIGVNRFFTIDYVFRCHYRTPPEGRDFYVLSKRKPSRLAILPILTQRRPITDLQLSARPDRHPGSSRGNWPQQPTLPGVSANIAGMNSARWAVLSLMMWLVAAGCQEQVVGTSWGGYGDAPAADRAAAPRAKPATAGQWAIALNRFEGPDHVQAATRVQQQLSRATGMDVWTRDEGTQSVVYSGRYPALDDPRAQSDLERWRQMIATGAIRLPAVMLVPIVDAPRRGSMPQYDLRNAKGRGVYTLQIAYYDEQFGPTFRDAAEQAAATLRQDGEEAYYYHGPYRSMVTLGLFPQSEVVVDQKTGVVNFGPGLTALQKRYPNNLGNGLTIQEKRGDTVTAQESFPVRVPND